MALEATGSSVSGAPATGSPAAKSDAKSPGAKPSDAGDPSPRRWIVFAVVSLALFMASCDMTIVATGLPTLQHDLHATVNWSSWTITIYALGQVIAAPLAGRVSDLYGRKKIFLGAVAVFVAASLACGLAGNIYVLVVLRGIQALGGGGLVPSATGIVADEFGRDRDRAVGMFTSIFPIGSITGPVLGGLFVEYLNWRWIFLVNVPVGIALLIVGSILLPHGKRRPAHRFDFLGLGLLAGTMLTAMIGISMVGSSGDFADPAFILPIIASVTFGWALLRHSSRAEAPFIPARLLRGHGFGAMNAINFAFGCAGIGFAALLPLYAQDRYGLTTLGSGTLLSARSIGVIVISAGTVYALRRVGTRKPMLLGTCVVALSMFLLAIRSPFDSAYLWLSLGAGIGGLGMGVMIPASNNAILYMASDQTAAISGLRAMFRQAGSITGISITTAVLASARDPGSAQAFVLVVVGAVTLCTIPFILRVPDHKGSW